MIGNNASFAYNLLFCQWAISIIAPFDGKQPELSFSMVMVFFILTYLGLLKDKET